MSNEDRSIDLVERWRQGDEHAASLLYGRYIEQMMRVIVGQIPSEISPRIGAEDVAQSVFRTAFRRIRNGEFQFRDDEDLWKLLVTIALNKARKQTSRNLAGRRDVNRETRISDVPIDESLGGRLVSQPTISDVLAFRETLDHVLCQLKADEADVVQLLLEGYTQQEIASQLEVTSRTIRRKVVAIRQSVADLFRTDACSSPESP